MRSQVVRALHCGGTIIILVMAQLGAYVGDMETEVVSMLRWICCRFHTLNSEEDAVGGHP